MTDNMPNPTGADSNPEHGLSEQAWLNDMLQRHPVQDDDPLATSPGWLLRGERALAELWPRSEAYLRSGGVLGREELKELYRYLEMLHAIEGARIEDGTANSMEGEARARERLDGIGAFALDVRTILRGHPTEEK